MWIRFPPIEATGKRVSFFILTGVSAKQEQNDAIQGLELRAVGGLDSGDSRQ
jgi:hypothetical protein